MNNLAPSIQAPLAGMGELTNTSLSLPDNLKFDEWEAWWTALHTAQDQIITRSSQLKWWRGDLLLYGEKKYGERYAQAIEVTGRAYNTLSTEVSVARAFPPDQRREELPWSHHRVVAWVDDNRLRDELLNEAIRDKLSKEELRLKVQVLFPSDSKGTSEEETDKDLLKALRWLLDKKTFVLYCDDGKFLLRLDEKELTGDRFTELM